MFEIHVKENRNTDIIENTRQKTTTSKTNKQTKHNTTQKTKKMSHTDPTKDRGYVNTDNQIHQLIKRLFMDAKSDI